MQPQLQTPSPGPAPTTTLSPAARMKAVIQPAYGGPEVLEVGELPVPTVAEDAVLVRVAVGGVNKGDWHLLTGTPYLVRAVYGFSRPSRPVLGMAMAGRVVAVGAKVTGFAEGDLVCAEVNRGAFAEYCAVPAKDLAKLPAGLDLEAAATIPVSGTTALQAVRDAGKLQAGQRLLVNGASGGVGCFAVQIAKAMGAEVTAVCSAGNAALVRSLGADHVINYAAEDFTRGERRYDVILDLVGNHGRAALRGVLTPKGRLLAAAGGADHPWVGPMLDILAGVVTNTWSAQPFVPVANKPNATDLAAVAALMVEGKVRPVIDRRHTLDEVQEAVRYLGTGRVRGKIVVTV